MGIGLAVLLFCSNVLICAQSLGEIARQQRTANAKNSHHASHVVTDEDIASKTKPGAEATLVNEDQTSASSKEKDPKTAALQTKIKTLKQRIADLRAHMVDLQEQIDKWNSENSKSIAIHGSGCWTGAYKDWCDTPKRLQADAEKTQAAIEGAQKDLEQIQEQVRRMGYGNAFYDPE